MHQLRSFPLINIKQQINDFFLMLKKHHSKKLYPFNAN
jgi:hypothetical protein